jgi:hypothetical protein
MYSLKDPSASSDDYGIVLSNTLLLANNLTTFFAKKKDADKSNKVLREGLTF